MNIIEQYMKLPELELQDIRDYIANNLKGLCDDIIVSLYCPGFNDGDTCVTSIWYFHVKIGDELIFVGEGTYKETDPEKFACGQVVEVSDEVRKFVQFLATNRSAYSIQSRFLCCTDERIAVSIMTGQDVETPDEDW